MKSLLRFFRHTRVWFFSLILPALLGFALLYFSGKSVDKRLNPGPTKVKFALIEMDSVKVFGPKLEYRKDLERIDVPQSKFQENLKEGTIDFALVIPSGFTSNIDSIRTEEVTLYHIGKSGYSASKAAVRSLIQEYEDELVADRLDSLGLWQSYINPISIREQDLTQLPEKIESGIATYSPLLLALIAFLGIIAPSILGFSEHKKKEKYEDIPSWDKAIGMSIIGGLSVFLFLAFAKIAVSMVTKMPPFMVGIIGNYFSWGNIILLSLLQMVWLVMWSALSGSLSRRAEKPFAAFSVHGFLFIIYFILLGIAAGIVGQISEPGRIAFTFVPGFNDVLGCGNIIRETQWDMLGFTLLGMTVWGVLGILSMRFIKK